MADDDLRHHPLNAGSRSLARDPADLYEHKEKLTCMGCCHIEVMSVAGSEVSTCGLGRGYGRRCRSYAERKPVRW